MSRAAFWFVGILLGAFLFAASAPSPLYSIYQGEWGFAPITLTAIYAVYALGAVGGLLVLGRISDYVGRKPAALVGIAIQLLALASFIGATGVEWLFVARALQGLGAGIAAAALTAWLVDLQPAGSGLGSLVGGIAPLAGLGLGGLVAGWLVDDAPDPLHLVFWVLAAFFLVAVVLTLRLPEVTSRRPGALRSLVPNVAVPPVARGLFAAVTPSLVAIWAIVGLYLSLGASLAISLLRATNHVAGGLVIAALLVTAAAASYAARKVEPIAAVRRGSIALMVGVGVTIVGVWLGSITLLLAGAAIAGIGVGPGFSGIVRGLTPLVAQHERASLVAAIYLGLYVAFGIPAVIAGAAVGAFGLRETTSGYGIGVVLLAGLTYVALVRSPGRRPAT